MYILDGGVVFNGVFQLLVMYLIEKNSIRDMTVVIGQKAPNFGVSEWVQGAPTNFDQEKDHIILVEVFQVNCPGCFLYGIPEVINIYNKYKDEGVRVLGIATAFEDFDKNTLENLKMLAETGKPSEKHRKHYRCMVNLRKEIRFHTIYHFHLPWIN